MTTEQTTKPDLLERLKTLAEDTPDVYRFALAFVAGIGTVDAEVGNAIKSAVEYVEKAYGND